MNSASETSLVRKLREKLAARKAWEAENPKLAAEWSEALHDDARWEYERELERARWRAEADAPRLLAKVGVPKRAIEALGYLDTSCLALKAAMEWAETGRPAFLWLMGGPGTGKTVSAAWCARQALLNASGNSTPSGGIQPVVVRWVHAVELGNLSTFDESDRAFFEDCLRARLLVLDDFGSENMHPEAMARLERLINHRYAANLATVISTNLSQEQLAAPRFSRIEDRLREVAEVYECGDKSMRGRP